NSARVVGNLAFPFGASTTARIEGPVSVGGVLGLGSSGTGTLTLSGPAGTSDPAARVTLEGSGRPVSLLNGSGLDARPGSLVRYTGQANTTVEAARSSSTWTSRWRASA